MTVPGDKQFLLYCQVACPRNKGFLRVYTYDGCNRFVIVTHVMGSKHLELEWDIVFIAGTSE